MSQLRHPSTTELLLSLQLSNRVPTRVERARELLLSTAIVFSAIHQKEEKPTEKVSPKKTKVDFKSKSQAKWYHSQPVKGQNHHLQQPPQRSMKKR